MIAGSTTKPKDGRQHLPARGSSASPVRSPAVLAIVLGLLAFALFSRTGSFNFVDYDDSDYVSANHHVLTGLSPANILWAFTTGHASNWHPLTWLSHMLDCQIFGNRPGPPHLVNAALHALNAALLFLLLRRLTAAHWRSATVAALFAFHPLHVESVAWISERKDVLSTLFFLLTLWAYARYAAARGFNAETQRRRDAGKEPKQCNREATGSLNGKCSPAPGLSASTSASLRPCVSALTSCCLAVVFFALGLMSKPMLVTLPFVLLLLDFWPLKRINLTRPKEEKAEEGEAPIPSARDSHALPRRNAAETGLTSLLLEKLSFVLLSAASCVVTFVVQREGGAVSTSLSLAERLANAVISYARYLGKTFWPLDLSVLYPHPGHWPAWQVGTALALVTAITVAVILLARTRPFLPVGWFWFCGTLVPVIGIVQVGIQSMADRYMYIPSIGLFLAVVWGLHGLAQGHRRFETLLAPAAALAIVLCAALTFRQAGFWQNTERLFTRAVAVTSRNYLAHNNLGYYFSNHGRVDEAIAQFRMALEIKPDYDDALNNLGHALAKQKNYSEAIRYYQAALRLKPDHLEVHNNYGNALSELGQTQAALEHFRFVLDRNPDHADAHNNLGIVLAMQGKLEEAISHFRDAIRCKPDYASAYSNLGNAYAVQHLLPEAIAQYTQALRLNPKDAQAHNNLGNVLAEQGRLDDAVSHYSTALKLNADNPEAHCNLGIVLLRQSRRELAIPHFREALRLKPDYAEARKQLEALAKPTP